MDNPTLAGILTTLADGVAAFAVLQNIAVCYELAKREFKIRLDAKFCRPALLINVACNALYCVACWWLGTKTFEVSPPEGMHFAIAQVAVHGRWAAIAFFAFVTSCFIFFYNDQRFWGVPLLANEEPSELPGRTTVAGSPADTGVANAS